MTALSEQITLCSGSNERWVGEPVPTCPTCERTPRALGVRRPARWHGRWSGQVPAHWE